MCGIAGIFVPKGATLRADTAAQAVKAMTLSMVHRGPDGHGQWEDERGRCFLGHRRLSIIDTSDAGLQPMGGADDRWVITFNGEIYNYRELKAELQAHGVQFQGRTDTEVLLEAVARSGVEALPRLDGMFAFAAFDKLTGKLLIARDPFGEKPLYYTTLASGAVAFASELQGLELLPGFDPMASLDSMAEVLSFQYIGAPRSIYESVRKIEPGCWLEIDADGTMSTGRFFKFEPHGTSVGSRTMSDLADELEDILVRSLERRLIADVPLGAFLSGGVDSSVVCALVRRKLKVPLKTFSTGFSDAPESEHLIARAFAEHLGTEHFENIVSPDVSGFLDRIGEVLDEPNGDSSCLPTFLLSQFVREHVTVAVSGDGGDEMFGGYGRYFATLEDRDRHQESGQSGPFHPGPIYYGNRILVGEETFIQDLFGFVPQGYAGHVARVRAQLDGSVTTTGLLEGMRRQDVENYLPGAVLPKVDRMSMRNSLEVRTPFLNVELARFAERLPESVLVQNGRGKLVLRELAYRYLPRELVDLPKKGFGLPMSDWARESLLGVAQDLLLGDEGRLAHAFGWERLNRYFQHQTRHFSAYQLWGVVMLEHWLRKHPAELPRIEQAPAPAPKAQAEQKAAEAPPPGLDAIEIAPAIFMVDERLDPRDILEPHPAAAMRIRELQRKRGPSAAAQAQSRRLRLPYWGEPLPREQTRELMGATLVFASTEAFTRFDYVEYAKYLAAGVCRVLLPNPYQLEEVTELEFQLRGRLSRAWAAARLFLRRGGGGALSSKMRALLGLGLINTEGFPYCKMGRFSTVADVADTDITGRYALFEGHLQMLPLATRHGEIGERAGRYSVYHQEFHFAPIANERAGRRPYWFVPIDDTTEHYLPICVRHHKDIGSELTWIEGPAPPRTVGAIEIAPSVYLAATEWNPGDAEQLHNPVFNRIRPSSMMRIRELAKESDARHRAADTRVLRLPWGERLSRQDARKLAGATLVFADHHAARHFDYAQYLRYLAAGVRRVLLPSQYKEDEVVELEFQRRGRLARAAAAARLFMGRAGGGSLSSRMRVKFGLQQIDVAGFPHCKMGRFDTVTYVPETDITDRYVLFEGHRQMLPLETGHEEFRRLPGRYSVWQQEFHFSPIVDEPIGPRPYWFVPVDKSTERHMPIRVRRYRTGTEQEARVRPDQVLEQLLGGNEPVSLRPGDRIVVHTHSLPPGGAERQWLYLAQSLKDAGYDVVFVTSFSVEGTNGHYLPDLVRTGIKHVDAMEIDFSRQLKTLIKHPVLRDLSAGWVPSGAMTRVTQLAAVFEDLKPKVVYTQLDEPNLTAALAALIAKVPRAVLSFRNYNPTNFAYLDSPWFQPCYQLLARAPNILFSGNFIGANEDYARWIGIDPARVGHVPNAIEPERFPKASEHEQRLLREELGLKPDDQLILGVFRLSEEKNPFLFVDVCARLCAERDNLVCAIAGSGMLEGAMRERIRAAGFEDRIRVLGARRDVNVLMSVATLLLQTPGHEGMPNAVMEAQLLGVPVVSTAAGGTGDIVIDHQTGLLCPIGDERALFSACASLLDDEALAQAMGSAAQRRMRKEFRKDLLGRRYLRLVDPQAQWLEQDGDACTEARVAVQAEVS